MAYNGSHHADGLGWLSVRFRVIFIGGPALMNNEEVYEALRFVKPYISEPKQHELFDLLDRRDAEGAFPPSKGIRACIHSDSNGIEVKAKHQDLWGGLCFCCV